MKKHILATIVALAASTAFATAGSNSPRATANAAAEAVSNSNSNSGAASIATGGNVTFNTPGNQHIRTSGTTTVRAAPQVVAPSMSSGHPCAFAPLSVGVSVIGFGGAFGGQRIDDACLLAQMQVRGAAISMIAARNPQACRALEMNGNIAPGSCGGQRVQRVSAPVYAAPAGRRVVQQQAVRRVATNGSNCREVFATASTKKKVCS